jgi:hypothetical protein
MKRDFAFRMELKTQMRQYVLQHLPTLRDTFQFAWSNDLDLLSNIGKNEKNLAPNEFSSSDSSSCLDVG